MFIVILVVFIVGYACIALEHPLKINKTASALLLGVSLWTLLVIGGESSIMNIDLKDLFLRDHPDGVGFIDWIIHHELIAHLGEIAEILFFLLGAMTIVELVDTYGGFRIITDKIRTTSRVKFMWILVLLTFFMSAVLDNLTSTIVMITLLRKLMANRRERWLFASLIVLAANAGGAWSPIGDVTTIMLWVGGKVSAVNIIAKTFLASMVSIVVPLVILSFKLKGNFTRPRNLESAGDTESTSPTSNRERMLILIAGVTALLCVPVFKTLTHLPPYLGMLGGLGALWVLTELLKMRHPQRDNNRYSITTILTKIDTPSILFFLGILLAVAVLQVCGHLTLLSASLDGIALAEPEKYFAINYIIGVFSAIVDNVPLVAGAMGMYDFGMDHYFWEFLAYCAGTGGSMLIIGSAAGVAAMGLEKIDFIWYFKKITLLAFIGYTAGALTFVAQNYSLIKRDLSELNAEKIKHTEYVQEQLEEVQGTINIC
ncbi:sodium:proton antiporter NhaD [Bacteroidales bacterium OttesenSCG-928-B11]|nr:sodium:proton antiporter NhaD [Bacteroidales bacterium OttesenSCG-928-E04]MDL2309120.1 sodium:proton antiporter NhaD [Bacteroidales bacterium OttesenSCG-928-C03]MDL2312013.1 sodium:proton antiporter NhaD [Bacteroidales bacterium OttesenSCG-928-B11]